MTIENPKPADVVVEEICEALSGVEAARQQVTVVHTNLAQAGGAELKLAQLDAQSNQLMQQLGQVVTIR